MVVTFFELGNAGRMGNALFEIACTLGYSKKYNVPFIFPKWEHQCYFQIPGEYFIEKKLIKYSIEYNEPNYYYTEIPFQENCSLSGYFQSWKYFDNCKDYIKEMLSPTPVENLNDYCCIHVRRGDYLSYPDHHPTQSIDWYMKAAEKIPNKKFMVFSDDVGWCKKNFIGSNFTINETSSLISDFRKMISCSNFIIANSSFSWWAAWLSNNNQKVVVAPSNWFGSKLNKTHPISDLIPPEWIIL